MAGRRRKKRKQNGNGKIWISIIVATLLIVMSVQIVGLYNKKETYMAKESSLKTQLEDEKNRSQEIKDYEEYTKTQKFIEDMAKSRLGLVYDNEVIFKKKVEVGRESAFFLYIGNFSISYIAKTLRAESHCGGKELCRRCDPPQAENPVSRILF